MGRIAMLSDIHSNWVALQAVLREVAVSGVDRVICLGDLVGYGPEPAKCVETIRKIGAAMMMGNHEIEVLKIRYIGTGHLGKFSGGDGYALGLIHSAKNLSEEQAVWLDETSFRVSPEHPCVVMVGSVGQSRVEGDLRAAWAIWDEERGVVELRKTEYDRLAAARAIVDAGLPMESAMRLLTDSEYKSFIKSKPL